MLEEWLEQLETAGIPSAPINTIDRALDHPQVRANDMVVAAPTSDGSAMELLGIPVKMSATPGKPGSAPPSPGQHNYEILSDFLGMETTEIDKLSKNGII